MSRPLTTQLWAKLKKKQINTHRQTKNLLIRRSSLLDGGHLYAMGDLAEGWKEQSNVWASLATGRNTWRDAEQDGKRARQRVRRLAERLAACTEHRKLSSPPPALLTVLRTITALCGIRHMLLADAVLVCLSVSARAGTDPGLEAPAAEYLPTGSRRGQAASQKRELEEPGNCWELLCVSYSLVSRVTMMRIGRLFIPPTQLELHIKLYNIVVNSVPTWERKTTLSERHHCMKTSRDKKTKDYEFSHDLRIYFMTLTGESGIVRNQVLQRMRLQFQL